MPQYPRQWPPRRSPDRILLRVWATTGWPDAYSRYRFTLTCPPHGLSYSTMEKLQYGESRAQASDLLPSTCSAGDGASVHTYLHAWGSAVRPCRPGFADAITCRCLHVDSVSSCNRIPLWCRPGRGGTFHLDTCRPVDESRSDIASPTDLCALRSRARSRRGSVARCHERRSLSRL